MRLRHRQRLLDDLDALALQHVGKARVVLEMDVVELGDQLALVAVPVMEQRRHDAARLELVVEPERVEHFERRRMVGAGARHLLEEIVVAERLDEADRNLLLREPQREAEPDRPCPDDDHPVGARPRHRHVDYFATTSLTAPAQPVWVRSNTMPSGSRYFAS